MTTTTEASTVRSSVTATIVLGDDASITAYRVQDHPGLGSYSLYASGAHIYLTQAAAEMLVDRLSAAIAAAGVEDGAA